MNVIPPSAYKKLTLVAGTGAGTGAGMGAGIGAGTGAGTTKGGGLLTGGGGGNWDSSGTSLKGTR